MSARKLRSQLSAVGCDKAGVADEKRSVVSHVRYRTVKRVLTVGHDNVYFPKFLVCFCNPGFEIRGHADVDDGPDGSSVVRSSLEVGELIATDVTSAVGHVRSLGEVCLHNNSPNAL